MIFEILKQYVIHKSRTHGEMKGIYINIYGSLSLLKLLITKYLPYVIFTQLMFYVAYEFSC